MDIVLYIFLFMVLYWIAIVYIDNVASKAKKSSKNKHMIQPSFYSESEVKQIAYYTKANFMNENIKQIKNGGHIDGK